MAFLSLTCPHCLTERVSMHSVADRVHVDDPDFFTVFFVCNNCHMGVCAFTKADSLARETPHQYLGNLQNTPTYLVINTYPKAEETNAPEHLPDHILRFYLQAAENTKRQHWDAAGMMCRKVLDVATRALDANLKGNLAQRIDRLANQHLITPAIQDWAHAIRLDGNEAAHEDEPMNEHIAKDLLSFTEVFLIYVFTLPAMLEVRRSRQID